MSMNRQAGLVVVFALAAWPEAAGAQQAERYEIRGENVAIYNLAGAVNLEAGTGSAVVVEVTRRGPDAARLEVATGLVDGRETLRIVYPADEVIYPQAGGRFETRLRVRDDGTFGGDGDGWRRREGRRVRVASSGSGLEAAADLRIQVPPDRRLTLHLAAGAVEAAGVRAALGIDTHHGTVRARDITGSLLVDTGSGSVAVTDVEGDVVIDTGSGGVDATRVRGRGLLIDTGSGSVTVADVAVEKLNVDTGSGRIEVRGSSARDVLLDTGSGSVTLDLTGDADRIEVDTGSGRVTVTVPESFGAELEIDTGSGRIDVDFPLQIRRWERTYVAGTIGDGRGRLAIDTGSGSVTLRRR